MVIEDEEDEGKVVVQSLLLSMVIEDEEDEGKVVVQSLLL